MLVRRPAVAAGAALFSVVGLLLLAAGFVRAGQHWQSNPELCASCHTDAATDWRASGASAEHRTCIECHSRPGLVGAIAAEAGAVPNLAAYLLGADPDSARVDVPRDYCTQCHADGDKLRHQHHDAIPARSGVTYCLQCHQAGPQEGETASVTGGSMIPTCSACHEHSSEASFRGSVSRSASQDQQKGVPTGSLLSPESPLPLAARSGPPRMK